MHRCGTTHSGSDKKIAKRGKANVKKEISEKDGSMREFEQIPP